MLLNDGTRSNVYSVEIDEKGVLYEANYLVPKAIKNKVLSTDNNHVKFTEIVAGISLTTNNKLNISSLLTGAEIDATLYTDGASAIRDNKVYIELYKTDANGGNAEKVYANDLSYNVSAFANPIVLSDLTPETNYYVRFYVYTMDNEKVYLYDVDTHMSGLIYRFYTLSSVGVKNIALTFNSKTSYANKRLVLQYSLDVVHGFDRIEYEVLAWNGSSYVPSGIVFPTSTSFSPLMTLSVDASPGSTPNIHWKQRYKVIIKPIGTYEANGVIREMDLGMESKEITLANYQEPYIGISSGKTADSIYFRVSVNDVDHLFVNDIYTATLTDENDNVIATITNNSTSQVSKEFSFNSTDYNLIVGKRYKFEVTARADIYNDANPDNYNPYTKSKTITYGDQVNLGNVSATQSSAGEQYIDIIFADSYRLSDITDVSYFISSTSTGEYITSGSDIFNGGNLKYNSTNNYYYYTINASNAVLNTDELYVITMNFYIEDSLVEQDEINYYYMAGGGS